MVGLQRIMLVLVVFGAGRHSVQWNVFTNKEVIQMKLLLSIFVAGTTALGSVALSPAAFTSAQAVAQGLNETFEAHPSTQDPSVKVTLETLARWETELSNWGKWGPTDQRGTLNYITPQKTRTATRLVEDGVTVNLGHFINEDDALDSGNFWPSEHQMTSVDPVTGKPRFALDAVSFSLHDGQLAHMDALCHYSMPRNGQDVIFNGYPQNMTADGCVGDLAINDMGPGYVTRAILVDMPLLRGVDYLEPATPIYVSDLEEWEDFAGVTVGPGDVLLVRAGRWARREALGPWRYDRGGAGLHASVLPWLKERGVALLVGDAVNDVQPSGVAGIGRPVHTLTQVILGLPLVDNGYLEDAAREAAARQRWEFMISWQISAVPNGTASPFNAIGTF